jgi:ferric iron reductase protein FhuF
MNDAAVPDRAGPHEADTTCQDRAGPDGVDTGRVGQDRVRAALAASAELGMFFRLADPANDRGDGPAYGQTGDPAEDAADWRPAESLYSARTSHLDVLIDATRRALGDCEPRVAASLFFQGYAARLLSPQLGCLVTSGCVPDVTPGQLRWRRPAGALIELGMTAGPGWAAPAGTLLALVVRTALDGHFLPLADAVRARTRISEAILADNAASALIGGLRLLGQQRGQDWRPLATAALGQPELRRSGVLLASEPFFVRRSCCLYYRAPGGGMCGDCPLQPTVRENALAIGAALSAPKPPPSTITAKAMSPR